MDEMIVSPGGVEKLQNDITSLSNQIANVSSQTVTKYPNANITDLTIDTYTSNGTYVAYFTGSGLPVGAGWGTLRVCTVTVAGTVIITQELINLNGIAFRVKTGTDSWATWKKASFS